METWDSNPRPQYSTCPRPRNVTCISRKHFIYHYDVSLHSIALQSIMKYPPKSEFEFRAVSILELLFFLDFVHRSVF
jgi:hypothetical protein